MKLSERDVRNAAELAALQLDDAEVEQRQKELSTILEYVAQLSELQTRGVVPTAHVHGVVNAFRDDVVKESLPVEEVEKMAPDFWNGSFRVPKIV